VQNVMGGRWYRPFKAAAIAGKIAVDLIVDVGSLLII